MPDVQPRLDLIRDWKVFERLCADLLEAKHFVVTNEPSIDTSGEDICAREEYRSHDGTRSLSIIWRVQCKHYAISNRKLDRREMEEILVSFSAVRGPTDGLLVMASTDVTEPAESVLAKYLRNHPHVKIQIWNGRHILAQLEQYAHLIARYGLRDESSSDYLKPFDDLTDLGAVPVLVISDQSSLAHDLTQGLRRAGFEVMSLPVWNYQHEYRRSILLEVVDRRSPRLVVVCLGDSFGTPLPMAICRFIVDVIQQGGSVLLFPFLAWLLQRQQSEYLREICPVTLADEQHSISTEQYWQMIVGGYRSGDFKFLLDADGFAENEYIELRPGEAAAEFSAGLSANTIGLKHSFEYLRPVEGAIVQWADTTGNPFVVTRQHAKGRVAYVNTCCHECMSLGQMLSPLRSQAAAAQLFANVMRWLVS